VAEWATSTAIPRNMTWSDASTAKKMRCSPDCCVKWLELHFFRNRFEKACARSRWVCLTPILRRLSFYSQIPETTREWLDQDLFCFNGFAAIV